MEGEVEDSEGVYRTWMTNLVSWPKEWRGELTGLFVAGSGV